MTEHTEGPWTWINSKPEENRAGRLFGNGELVADAEGMIYVNKMANAHLIAAAPEMLAALKGAMRIQSLWFLHNSVDAGHTSEAQALATMARTFEILIDKAEGKE